MIDEDLLAQLRAQHASLLRDKSAALSELSALVFNRPELHDAFRGSSAFKRWHRSSEQARQLGERIDELQQLQTQGSGRLP
jgi:hypothetical protein